MTRESAGPKEPPTHQGPLSIRLASTRVVVWLTLWLTPLVWSPATAAGGELRNTVKNLWSDGIRLQPTPPPFPSHDPHDAHRSSPE